MNTQAPMVVITLEEYNELIAIKTKFVEAFEKKKTILHIYSYSMGPGGWHYGYNLVNAPDVICVLNEQLDKANKRSYELEKLLTKDGNKRKWYAI